MVQKLSIKSSFLMFAIAVCAVFPSGILFADMTQKVDDLIVKSGLERQIGQLPDVISASFDQRISSDPQLKPEEATKIKDILTKSYIPSQMIQSFKNQIGKGISEKDMDTVLSWLSSPLGQKITQLEENASSGDAYNQMQEFAKGLQQNPPDPTRLDILNQLDQAAHISEYSIKMKIDMILTMAESMAAVTGQKDFSKSDLMAQVDSSRAQIEEGSRQESMVSGLFTYQTLTNEEIKQYVEFYTSPAGTKYAQIITQALLDVFQNSSKNMGEQLGLLIKEEKNKPAENKP